MPKGTSIILTEENIRDFDKKKSLKKIKRKKKNLLNFCQENVFFLLPAESRLDYST